MNRSVGVTFLVLALIGCDSGGDESTNTGAQGGTTSNTTIPTVPAGWTAWPIPAGNGHYYKILQPATTWTAAKTNAEVLGAHLVTITTEAEEQFVINTFLTGDNRLKVFWLGCSDAQTEDTFTWVTAEPFAYTNWKSGEPNGWDGEGEDYCSINWNAVRGPIGEWNDTLVAGSVGYDSGKNDGPYPAIIEAETIPKG